MRDESSKSNASELDEIIAGYLAALETGQQPERDRLMADHPHLADQLREFFADYDRMQPAFEQPPNLTSDFSPAAEPPWNQLSANSRNILQRLLHKRRQSEHGNFDVTHDATSPQRQPSSTIGPYKLLQQIGVGGMGEVWMAEQERPVRRRVALKLIKAGMDTKQVVARFEAERQALAMMDHQNIAKVLDVGTTDDGRPYFVMELVQGIPITKFCDQSKLSVNDRMNLFIPVCNAVQHAHQKGIIHRDLKPSNILVTLYDGRPVPKVIDFGLAKALQHQSKLTDKTLFTEFGQVVGTLQYMSPEQAEMNALDIDTRTDVYALGVLLYELLTGSTPIDRETIEKQAVLKILESIREIDPPRPSDRLSSSGDAITGISQQRQIDPRKLAQVLRGDLDWIVMKALEKDRTRRYETANGFAADVQRFLSNEAIEARPPSPAYRVRKFVHKNRGLVTSLASIAALLFLGIVGTSWFAIDANVARHRAEQSESNAISERSNAELARKLADQTASQARTAEQFAKLEAERAKSATETAEKANAETVETLARSNFFLANARWNQNRVGEAYELLYSIPKHHHNFEWHLARRLFEGSDMTLHGHSGIVRCVAFSPDGSRIVSGADSIIKLWDARTGTELVTLKGHTHSVRSVAFSPDCSRIVSGSEDKTIKLWDASTGSELLTLNRHTSSVDSVAYSPDGSRIISGGNDIKLWDARTGSELLTLKGNTSSLNCVAFSPDGLRIVSGGNDIKLWDARTGSELLTLKGHSNSVRSVAFSPDGMRIVSGGDDKTLKLWNARTGSELLTLVGHTFFVMSVAFSPDGSRIVSGSADKTLKLWDARTGSELLTLKGHISLVNNYLIPYSSVAFSPDGSRIVSGADTSLKLWDARTGSQRLILRGHTSWVRSLAFSLDGSRIVSCSRDNIVKLWDARTGSQLLTLKGHTGSVASVAFSPDGSRIVSGSADRTLKLWDAHTGSELLAFKGHASSIGCVAFSSDGSQIVSGSADKTVKLWDARTGSELLSLKGHTSSVSSVTFTPDRSVIVSGGDTTIRLWDARTGSELRTLIGHTNTVVSLAISPDGTRIVSGSIPVMSPIIEVKLWDVRTGLELLTFKGHSDSVYAVAFSPDGSRVVTGSTDIKLWDARTGSELLTLFGHNREGGIMSIAFSPDGSRIVSSVDKILELWDVQMGLEGRMLQGHTGSVTSVAFSLDSSKIVSGSWDQTLKLWDLRTANELLTLKGHTDWITSEAFSPDGSRIVSGSNDTTLMLWDARTGLELLTLQGHTMPVISVTFSSDGKFIFSEASRNTTLSRHERFTWNSNTGERIDDATLWVSPVQQNRSPDGRWLVVPSHQNDVLIVDREHENDPDVREYRLAKSRLDPWWHREQAEVSEGERDWYSAAFHRAWQLKGQPGNALTEYHLRRDIQQCKEAFERNLADLIPGQMASSLETYLASIVREALALPKGTEVTEEDALKIDTLLKERLSALKDGQSSDAITPDDFALITLAFEKHPTVQSLRDTLAAVQQALGN